jgi:hypothetical protein
VGRMDQPITRRPTPETNFHKNRDTSMMTACSISIGTDLSIASGSFNSLFSTVNFHEIASGLLVQVDSDLEKRFPL